MLLKTALLQKAGIVSEDTRSVQAWICCVLLLIGMIYAPFLQSLSFILLVFVAVFDWRPDREFPFGVHPALWSRVKAMVSRPDYWAPGLYFLIVLLGMYSLEDPGYWLARLRIKAPFLVLPLVFFVLPPFSKRLYGMLWYVLVGVLSVTSAGILIYYFLHFEAVQALLKSGQAMPMPCNHIRYSLLQTMGIVGGIYLLERGFYLAYRWEHYILATLVGWLIIAQHLIAVRSGLAVLYVVLLYMVLRYIWRTRRWVTGAVIGVLLAIGPVVAYQAIPSFRARIDYARYDLDMYRKQEQRQQLSDASRWVSWEIGWALFKSSPVVGVGAGNLRKRVEQAYEVRYPNFQNHLMPHNQFLFVAAGSGLVGLAMFLLAFAIPLFYKHHYRHVPFFALHINLFVSCMVEATLESAMGVAFFLFFWGIGMNYQERHVTPS